MDWFFCSYFLDKADDIGFGEPRMRANCKMIKMSGRKAAHALRADTWIRELTF